MRKLVCLLFAALAGCSTALNMSQSSDRSISKVVFRRYTTVMDNGEKNMEAFQDSLVAKMKRETELDAQTEALVRMSLKFASNEQDSDIHIEVDRDTIWRYEIFNGKMRGQYVRIDPESGILHFHDRNDRSKIVREFDLFNPVKEFQVVEDRNYRKEIMGLPCFKVTIRQKEEYRTPVDLGDTFYEMYVTDRIALPAYALRNVSWAFPGYFPLELRLWSEKLEGIQEVYEIKEMR